MKNFLILLTILMATSVVIHAQTKKPLVKHKSNVPQTKLTEKTIKYCYSDSSVENEGGVEYTIIVQMTITIKNGIAKGSYSSIMQRNESFAQGESEELTGKVINNVIQGTIVSSIEEQYGNVQKTGKKNIKLNIGETILWNNHKLTKCDH